MSRQDKATTERNAKTLRELVKRPENKVCADCKRNDPRWASWNLGVFVCIRCSGIHRSMGTHISKVKSVDLDMWTPDQMNNVQIWGNERANLYWEAHLKPGHIPPDHKMESFIRSKYESRRWAMEGPPPADPSVLDGGASASAPAPAAEPASPPQRTQQQQPIAPPSGSNTPTPQAQGSRKPQRTLLSSNAFTAPTPAPAVVSTQPPAAPPASSVQNDIFSLDFTPPAANTPSHSHSGSLSGGAGAAKNNTKNDIMSLFSSAPPPGAQSILGGGQPAQAVPTNTAPTSFMGTNGTGLWGVQSGWQAPAAAAPSSDPWGSFASAASPVQQQQQPQQPAQQAFFGAAPMAPAQPPMNVWGAPPAQAQPNAFNAGNVWGAQPAAAPANAGGANAFDLFTSGGAASNATAGAGAAKKDDAFDNLWG